MHRIYKARFYNGISSKAFTVNVSFETDHLYIQFDNETGGKETLLWPKHEIKEVQYSSGIISLRHGESFPYQQLDITDREFIEEYKNHFKVSSYNRMIHHRKKSSVVYILLGLIAFVLAGYFFLLPLIADIFARTFPKSLEISLGEKLYNTVLEDETIDSSKTANINLFFKQMKVDGDYPVRISVTEKSVDNAFSLPGGGMVVYDKILEDMNSYEELAALLSHEYSHIQLRHPTRNLFRSLSGYIFISMLLGDVGGVSAIIIQNAENLKSLQYTRSLEHEADENGLKILKENQISAEGMERLFNHLKKEGELQPAELLNSHPDLDSRIDFVKEFKTEFVYTGIQNDSMKYYFERIKNE